jgi:predicted RNase H-like HicB family nuclease
LLERKFAIAGNGIFGDTLNMRREFNVVIERDAEGYYVATVPDLRGCHTQARSLDKLLSRIREAIALCLEVEDSGRTTSSEFVGVQRVTVEV